MKRFIIVKLQFEGIHQWEKCPLEDVGFLKHPHRHIFHVEAKKAVNHNDRDIEIIRFKRMLETHIQEKFYENPETLYLGNQSCEMMAEELVREFNCYSVKVLEDNENGAEIYNH